MPKHDDEDPLGVHEHEHPEADRNRTAGGDRARAKPHEQSGGESPRHEEDGDENGSTMQERPRRAHDPDTPVH